MSRAFTRGTAERGGYSTRLLEIDAEARSETMIDKVGIVFVFDREMNVLAAIEH